MKIKAHIKGTDAHTTSLLHEIVSTYNLLMKYRRGEYYELPAVLTIGNDSIRTDNAGIRPNQAIQMFLLYHIVDCGECFERDVELESHPFHRDIVYRCAEEIGVCVNRPGENGQLR